MHILLSTMRLTDFLADLMSIENYQKLLINKARKYQIKQLRDQKRMGSDGHTQVSVNADSDERSELEDITAEELSRNT